MKENYNKKRDIIEKYNSTSDYYDRRYSKIQLEKFQALLRDESLNKHLILDAGCGTGLLYFYMINNLKEFTESTLTFVAIDISWNMLKIFRSKIQLNEKTIGVSNNLILSDLENLPLRKQVFDEIFSITSLQNLSDIFKGIDEILRVIRDEGDLKLSILKKDLRIEEVQKKLKVILKEIKIIDIQSLEDLIILGKV